MRINRWIQALGIAVAIIFLGCFILTTHNHYLAGPNKPVANSNATTSFECSDGNVVFKLPSGTTKPTPYAASTVNISCPGSWSKTVYFLAINLIVGLTALGLIFLIFRTGLQYEGIEAARENKKQIADGINVILEEIKSATDETKKMDLIKSYLSLIRQLDSST